MYTVLPTNKLTVNDVITRADEQMYQEKLRYRRTQLAELEDVSVGSTNVACFQYDPTQLYEALIKSTDDFIYICNMKTGIFRYSPAQVKVFNLPGEIIDHPLPFWNIPKIGNVFINQIWQLAKIRWIIILLNFER